MNASSIKTKAGQCQKAQDKKAKESSVKLVISGILGAFCYGLTDLFSNNDSAALIKLGNVINEHFSPSLSGVAVPFLILILLGGVLCWVYQPSNRLDAFTRGFTVFAALNIVSPYQNHALNSKDQCVDTSGAKVEVSKTRQPGVPKLAPVLTKTATVVTLTTSAAKIPEKIIVTFLDPKTHKVVREFATGQRFVITETKPLRVKISAPGFRSVIFDYHPQAGKQDYSLALESTRLPMAIQVLLGPKSVDVLQ